MGFALLAAAMVLSVPEAGAQGTFDFELGGEIKSFFLAYIPYEHVLMPEDPSGAGILNSRLIFEGGFSSGERTLRLVAHGTSAAMAPQMVAGAGTLSTSNTGALPEAVDLTWALDGGDELGWTVRADRLVLEASIPQLDLAVGRQAITFGHALLFTPLDLVAPFHPAVIDQSYKPGADAVRLDAYAGMSRASLVAAYAGDWDREGLVAVAYGQSTLGVWDLGVLTGSVHGDWVAGFTSVGSVGPLGLWVEGSLTLPTEEDPFVRVVGGGNVAFGEGTMIALEVYYQSLGATDPADYLSQAASARYARGELWGMGTFYLGATLSQPITPLVGASVFALANLQDPSALVGPGLSWSVSEEVSFSAGAFLGVGERPGDVDLEALMTSGLSADEMWSALPVKSEFGLVPAMAHASLMAWF